MGGGGVQVRCEGVDGEQAGTGARSSEPPLPPLRAVKGPVVKTVKARLGCHQGHAGLAARTFNRGERGLAFRHDAPLKWRRTTPSASTARADDRKYLEIGRASCRERG